MGHETATGEDPAPAMRLDAAAAAKIATTLQALATPSRLMILTRLREAPCTVTDLAESSGMAQAAAPHHRRPVGPHHRLRPLRQPRRGATGPGRPSHRAPAPGDRGRSPSPRTGVTGS